MTNLEAYRTLLSGAFTLEMNANDFFAYGAMSVPIESCDIKWIIPIIEKYDGAGLDACLAYIQNQEPREYWRTPMFLAAMNELKEMQPFVGSDFDNGYHYNHSEVVHRKVVIT